MNILQRYIVKSYISAFILGMLVLTFVLSIGLLVKATQLVIKGLDPNLILNFLVVSIPESFSFTIPLSVLVSALLVFGRLSTDGEISALRACGINIWNVVSPLILFGLMLTALSIFINSSVAPRGYYSRHLISSSVKGGSALKLLEPGHFIEEFPGMTFWFAEKDGDTLYNVLIYDRSKSGFTREIRAEKALVTYDDKDITLDMYHVRIDPFSESQPGAATAGKLVHVIKNAISERQYRPKVGGFLNAELYAGVTNLSAKTCAVDLFLADRTTNSVVKAAHALGDGIANGQYDSICGGFLSAGLLAEMTNDMMRICAANDFLVERREELNAMSANVEAVGEAGQGTVALVSNREEFVHVVDKMNHRITGVEKKQANRLESVLALRANLLKRESELKTELNRRFALGITPIVFLLIGIPLGMKTSRKESNTGVAVSIGVMIMYYALMILVKGQAKNPAVYPHLMIWFAPAVCIIAAIVLIRRNR